MENTILHKIELFDKEQNIEIHIDSENIVSTTIVFNDEKTTWDGENINIKLGYDPQYKNEIFDLFRSFYYHNYYYSVPRIDVKTLPIEKIQFRMMIDILICLNLLFNQVGASDIYKYAKWYTSTFEKKWNRKYKRYITYETCYNILSNKFCKDRKIPRIFKKVEFKRS